MNLTIRKCVIGCNADTVPDVGYNDTECSKDFYVKLGEKRQGRKTAFRGDEPRNWRV